jgi:hypothetical protein
LHYRADAGNALHTLSGAAAVACSRCWAAPDVGEEILRLASDREYPLRTNLEFIWAPFFQELNIETCIQVIVFDFILSKKAEIDRGLDFKQLRKIAFSAASFYSDKKVSCDLENSMEFSKKPADMVLWSIDNRVVGDDAIEGLVIKGHVAYVATFETHEGIVTTCKFDTTISDINADHRNTLVEDVSANVCRWSAAGIAKNGGLAEHGSEVIEEISIISLLVHFVMKEVMISLGSQIVGSARLGVDSLY